MSAASTQKWRARILLVEDDPGDQELTRRGLERRGSRAELRIVSDGDEALEYLFHRGRFEDPAAAPRPHLILLDLNLPGTCGSQVLRATKQDTELRHTPVVVLSTSAAQRDIDESHELGCNSYVVKPLDAHGFMTAVQDLYDYWFEVAELPNARDP